MYLDDNFRQYVREKYFVPDEEVFKNNTILQMIYALEWYDIPRSIKPDLIEFHPYLNEDDYEKLYYIKSQHNIEQGISGLLFFMVCNRMLNNNGPQIFRNKRYVRFPVALVTSCLLTYGLNTALLKTLLHKDLKEENLDKYYELDLNANMMKQDLAEMGINIKASNFNLDAAQKRIDESTKKV